MLIKFDGAYCFFHDPIFGNNLLDIYHKLKNKSIGHFCDRCDHCDFFCNDLQYGGKACWGGGWCWHDNTKKSDGICIQACEHCLKKICDFHFIMRMIGSEYNLPKDVVYSITKHIVFPTNVLTKKKELFVDETNRYNEDPVLFLKKQKR